MDILPSWSGSWSIPKLPTSDSWSITRLPSLFELGESHDGNLSSSESCSSYEEDSSDESDDEFLLVQENYMIIARNNSNHGGIDSSDDLSDIGDSCATSTNASIISGSSCVTGGTSTCSVRQQQPRHAQAAQLQSDLEAITEESSTIEESDPCEAYLRAKMTSLWTRIQESAQTEELTATPSTERDAELLRAYERKNDSLIFLMKHL